MDTQETVLVSKVPMLKPNEFDMWKIRIRQYMLLTDYGMWEVVENGPGTDEEAAEGGARPPPRSDADRKRRQTEMKALSTLLEEVLWNQEHKEEQKAILKQQYENFTSLKNESMTQTFDRFNRLIGELATVDVKMDKDDVNRKFLRSLGKEWTIYTVSFRQGDDLEDKELEDLYNDLKIFEAEVETKKKPFAQFSLNFRVILRLAEVVRFFTRKPEADPLVPERGPVHLLNRVWQEKKLSRFSAYSRILHLMYTGTLIIMYPPLIAFVQIKFQNENYSPFDTHGCFMIMSIVALPVATFTSGVLFHLNDPLQNSITKHLSNIHYTILQTISSFSGILTPFSLIMVLFIPHNLNWVDFPSHLYFLESSLHAIFIST
ncbi:hypothetical protein OSB04_020542 [Centaurea solstitialis]|uniref:Uncharacterized protein n=1 Tax=Centaurea solstitialis TaxID=347529 RepID=A0AA38WFC2_9ASTR|nr:hypothetical protein OSB04_020542 [Centaurea solstitialis]